MFFGGLTMSFSLKVGDQIEVFIRAYNKHFEFESKVVYIIPQGPGYRADNIVILWDEGVEVTPYDVKNKYFPQHLEGRLIYCLYNNPNYFDNAYGWGKVVKKITPQVPVKQVRSKDPGGMYCACTDCTKFVQYASTNMSDGTFWCRECRKCKSYLIPSGISFVGFDGERE